MKDIDLEKIINNIDTKYKKAVQHDVNDQWRLGYEVCKGVVVDTILEEMGYDVKKLETNALNLVHNLLEKARKSIDATTLKTHPVKQ